MPSSSSRVRQPRVGIRVRRLVGFFLACSRVVVGSRSSVNLRGRLLVLLFSGRHHLFRAAEFFSRIFAVFNARLVVLVLGFDWCLRRALLLLYWRSVVGFRITYLFDLNYAWQCPCGPSANFTFVTLLFVLIRLSHLFSDILCFFWFLLVRAGEFGHEAIDGGGCRTFIVFFADIFVSWVFFLSFKRLIPSIGVLAAASQGELLLCGVLGFVGAGRFFLLVGGDRSVTTP